MAARSAPSSNLQGQEGRLFGEVKPTADETQFQLDNTSSQYYDSPYYLLHKNLLQPVPPPRTSPPRVELADILGSDATDAITAAKKIVFHSVGDTGAAKVNHFQTAQQAIAHEAGVADAMARDVQQGGADAPAFFFHLGDVVYNFGEGKYYYDQFYEPFRDYDRPIFAIPGNHDGMVFGDSPDTPSVETLTAFLRNFCAESPGPSPDAGGLVRSTMTQPGVYFTLDAPLVSIIGLYTNVIDGGPGVISSEDGHYPSMNDDQLTFLTGELERLKPAREAGELAVLIACHHPPVSADSKHGGTTGLANDIDSACQQAGLWPDAVLSGHAHLYQRFTREVDGREIPYVVSGSGGFAATPPQGGAPPLPWTKGEYTLVNDPLVDFGYLTLTVDATGDSPTLTIAFQAPTAPDAKDSVTVDLATGKLVS
jgi:hypothetical protein